MDEKELSKIPKDTEDTMEPDQAPVPETPIDEREKPATDEDKDLSDFCDSKEEAQGDSDWKFDAQVETDLSKMSLSYSGKEIEIVAPLLKEEPASDSDNIVISKAKVRKTFKLTGIILAAILGAGILAAGVVYSFFIPNNKEWMTPANTALSLDGTNISVGSFNYYYNNFTNDNYLANYAQQGLDTSVDYDKQYYDESTGETWADYFENTTVEELRYIGYYYNAAKEAGMKLSKTEQEQLDAAMDQVVVQAQTAGQTTGAFLKEQYGEYVGLKTMRKTQEMRYLAQRYMQQLSTTDKVSEEEVQSYRNDNLQQLEIASFRYLPMPYTADNKEAIRVKSEELKGKLTDSATFTETVKPYAEKAIQTQITDEYTLITNVTSLNENIPANIREWLFTNGVKVNDTSILDSEEQSCFYVVLMDKAPHINEEMLFSVRHLLVKAEGGKSGDGTAAEPTEEQWKAAQDKAQGFLDQFNKTDKSELAFAQLADENSEDIASTSGSDASNYGGLLAQNQPGKLVAPFEAWSLDPSRKYGDVGMVKTEYGYHLIYYISNQEAWKYTAQSAVLGNKQDENVEKITTKKKMGFKHRAIAKPASK